MAKTQDTDNTEHPTKCGATGALILSSRECKLEQLLWKAVWQFLTKLTLVLPYDLALWLLGIDQNNLKTYIHIQTCTWMFISCFIHNCQELAATGMSFNRWIGKLWYIHIREYYSMMKKKWATKRHWRNLGASDKCEKPVWEGYILYNFNNMTFGERKNYRDNWILVVVCPAPVNVFSAHWTVHLTMLKKVYFMLCIFHYTGVHTHTQN